MGAEATGRETIKARMQKFSSQRIAHVFASKKYFFPLFRKLRYNLPSVHHQHHSFSHHMAREVMTYRPLTDAEI